MSRKQLKKYCPELWDSSSKTSKVLYMVFHFCTGYSRDFADLIRAIIALERAFGKPQPEIKLKKPRRIVEVD